MNWHRRPDDWKISKSDSPIDSSCCDHEKKELYIYGENEPYEVPPGYSEVHEFTHARMHERGLNGPFTREWRIKQEFYAIGHSLHWILREYPEYLKTHLQHLREVKNGRRGLIEHQEACKKLIQTNLWKRCLEKCHENSDKD